MSVSENTIASQLLVLANNSIEEDRAEDEEMVLKTFLAYTRIARKQWSDRLYKLEQPRIRSLVDRKLDAEYPKGAARRVAEKAIKAEFPELF